MEKDLLRKSFINENIIPEEVLFRKKEAFSDGVSSHKKSWFEYIQDYVDKQVSNDEFEKYKNLFPSKEAYCYKKIFNEIYLKSGIKFEYWMPKWCNVTNEPSARILKEY
jgi:asparagine synthase (glutamine-hydrolysing)